MSNEDKKNDPFVMIGTSQIKAVSQMPAPVKDVLICMLANIMLQIKKGNMGAIEAIPDDAEFADIIVALGKGAANVVALVIAKEIFKKKEGERSEIIEKLLATSDNDFAEAAEIISGVMAKTGPSEGNTKH